MGLHRIGQHNHLTTSRVEEGVRVLEERGRWKSEDTLPNCRRVAGREEANLSVVGVLIAQPG